MNLIIREFPDTLADQLKHLTSSATLSKAVLAASSDYVELVELVEKLYVRLKHQDAEIDRLEGVIEGARAAAVQLFERTSQSELRV